MLIGWDSKVDQVQLIAMVHEQHSERTVLTRNPIFWLFLVTATIFIAFWVVHNSAHHKRTRAEQWMHESHGHVTRLIGSHVAHRSGFYDGLSEIDMTEIVHARHLAHPLHRSVRKQVGMPEIPVHFRYGYGSVTPAPDTTREEEKHSWWA